MPNLRGVTPQSNPEWVTLDFDDGTSSHPIHDPTGEYRQQVASIVPKVMSQAPPSPMSGALAQNDIVTGASPPIATDAPAPPMAPAPPVAPPIDTSHIPDAAMAGLGDVAPLVKQAQTEQAQAELARKPAGLPTPPEDLTLAQAQSQAAQRLAAPAPVAQTVSNESAPQPQAPDPYAPRYMQAGATGPSTQVTTQNTTQGLTAADRKKVDLANEAAVKAGEKANQEDYTAKSYQLMSDWQRLGEDAKKQIVEKQVLDEQQKFYDERLEKQYAKLDADAARKIDPSEAFAGDAGAYAFMAGFGDAISNFGAALAGRGPVADPSARIEGIINRSVRLQTEQKQADLEAGKISANRLEADREHVRFKLATVGKQMAENELDRAHTKDEYAALGAMKQRMEAIQQDARAKNAAATAKQETVSRTTQTQPGSPGGAVDYFLGEDQTKNGGWKAVEAHGARQAGGDQIENAVQRFSKATGYVWDPQALNGAGAFKDANGKVVSADKADVPGVTSIGRNFAFASGEMGREVQGALGDLAGGRAKIADPVGAVSDKSVLVQEKQMAAGTDEGAFRAMEQAARQLRTMRAKVDSESSPGVVNASRLRRQEERGFQASRPGLPTTRAATPEDLRGKPKAEPDGLPKGETR
jgi:hypothetical protein